MKKAVFLDRDGTINEEYGYVHSVESWRYTEGAIEALRNLKELGYLLFVITNQSGIARGYYNIDDVDKLHRHVNTELAMYGTEIDGFYMCPHHPNFTGVCVCRKPSPWLIQKACNDHDVNVGLSYMIGDKCSDVNSGISAGCKSVLVETGYGAIEKNMVPVGTRVFKNLLLFSEWVKSNNE